MASPTTAKTASAPAAAGSSAKPSVSEFSIRVPKASKKKFQVMRFNANLGVDFNEWKNSGSQIKMERENNFKEFKGVAEEEIPKFGAGSEYGKEAREEARRKKFGITAKKYKPEAQPWILKTGGKTGKKFKGIREGGVSDNTAYYVFTQAGKGIIEAYPLQEWYKFQPIQRYKALSAEEAEEEFGRRNKIINYFSVMVKKRLRNEEDGDPDELEEGTKAKGKGSKKKDKSELKISEMDDWVDSDEDNSGSDSDGEKKKKDSDDEGAADKKKKKQKAAAAKKKKKKKKDSDDEAFEDSDDGDEEGREMDYISDSSESGSDTENKANKELKGVAEEDALRKLLNSESESEDENEEKKKKENESNSDDDDKKKDGDKDKDKSKDGSSKKKKKDGKAKKSKPEKKSSNGKNGEAESSSELSPNSSDTDSDAPNDKPKATKSKESKETANSAASSRSTSPATVPGEKRKLTNAETAVAAAKKAKMDTSSSSSSYIPPSSETGVTEDAVRRYLMRKPMTTKELVHKFKSKKTNLTSDQLVNLMTQILKNINPVKQMIKNQLYLSLKPT